MARCTLDDLVPRIRCNKITLEPVRNVGTDNGVNYGEYEVHIDASVYDIIDQHDEGALSNFLLSDTFRRNVYFYGLFSRDMAVKNFVDFLRSKRGLKQSQLAYLFQNVVELVDGILKDPVHKNWFYDNKIGTLELIAMQSNSELSNLSVNPFTSSTGFHMGLSAGAPFYANIRDRITEFYNKLPTQSGGFSVTSSVVGQTIRLAVQMVYSDMEYISFRFDQVLTQEVLNFNSGIYTESGAPTSSGVRKLDDDGNVYYDFKIGTNIPAYTNGVDVSNCYFHSSTNLDMEQNLLDKGVVLPAGGIPLDYDTIDFIYNGIDECPILRNKRPASGLVQDFRISERISEIIRSDRINLFDDAIDKISLLTTEATLNEDGLPLRENGLTSQLFVNYQFEPGIYRVFTKGYFYFDILKFLRRKSQLNFLYESFSEQSILGLTENLTATTTIENTIPTDVITPYLKMPQMDIYRVRVDEEEPRELIKTKVDIQEIGQPIGASNYAQLYKFVDKDFEHLTDGEYVYEIELTIKDPIIDTVRFYAGFLKHMISVLRECEEYIHNNAGEYNELRDELSENAKAYIIGRLNNPVFKASHSAFEILFRMFTGYSLYDVAANDLSNNINFNLELWTEFVDHFNSTGEYEWSLFPIDISGYNIGSWLTDQNKLNRRAIENLHRIANDIDFGISRFVDTSSVTEYALYSLSSNPNIGTRASSELLYYKRRWRHSPVKAALDYRTMLTINSTQQEEYDASLFAAQYELETLKHTQQGTPIPGPMLQQMNFLTPARVGAHQVKFNSFSGIIGAATETYIKVIDATLRKPDVMLSEANAGIYSFSGGGYEGGVENLKNDSGVFETTLFEYGVTVKNLNAAAIETDIELEFLPLTPTFGIDFGRNSPEDRSEIVEANQQQMQEALEQLQADRSVVINSLFAEKIKKEDLVMNILVDKGAHHILDRRKIVTQSGDNEHKFEGFDAFEFASTFLNGSKPYPKLLNPLLIRYYSLANDSTHIEHAMRIMAARFIVDNTFLVFYLDALDEDLAPVWKELTAAALGSSSLRNAGTNATKILCKLERFRMRGTDMSIGHGATSELEITNKYFYLIV